MDLVIFHYLQLLLLRLEKLKRLYRYLMHEVNNTVVDLADRDLERVISLSNHSHTNLKLLEQDQMPIQSRGETDMGRATKITE